MNRILCSVAAAAALASAATSQVIITEIMYNPNSSEASPNNAEWVEIYNTTGAPIVLDGWLLGDEDGTAALPAGTTIGASEAIVLFSDGITEADFKLGWPGAYQAIPVNFASFNGLANSPTAVNEILMIADAGMVVIDTVNYEDSGAWPSDSPDGPSIVLLECFLDATANDNGANWRRSKNGLRNGSANAATATFDGADSGSPGVMGVTTAAAVFRNGVGSNPTSFISVTAPIVGTNWISTIDIAAAGAVASFITVTAAPFAAPTPFGELLIDVSLGVLAQDVSFGSHSIGLAADCTLAGVTLYAQGATFALGPIVKLENGLDLTFGSL